MPSLSFFRFLTHRDEEEEEEGRPSHVNLRFHNPVSESAPVARDAPTKPNLIRRVTSKLNISIRVDGLRSRPSSRTLPADVHRPRPPRATVPLPNSFVSKEHREAALRERGLLPPRKDFSQQEREADIRLSSLPSPASFTFGGSTEAERFKADWLAMNRTSESSDSDSGYLAPPNLHKTESGPLPDVDSMSRSGECKTDLPSAGKPSIFSSLPPLSTCHLEVLHEDPSEHGPVTPPPILSPIHLPIIVSSPVDDPSCSVIVESPISCTFSSSHHPGSTLESQSSSDHAQPLACRRRTFDAGDRPRKLARTSLSRLGTRSLTSLRRSVTESIGRTSTSTLSSADHASGTHRTAISPTMHSIGSIIRETRVIEDAESRRLSELAFLD